jgi:sugar/nucleoside kinase (ribokinase family)
MVDLTIVGDVNVDIITSPIEKYPEEDSQVLLPFAYLVPGGCACNTAIACANFGLKTRLIGKLGSDMFSNYLLKILKKFGIDCEIKFEKEKNTGLTFAVNFKKMTRSMFTYRGTNELLSINDFSFNDLEGNAVVVTGFNHLNALRKDVKLLFSYAKKEGMKTFFDPNWDPEGWTENRLNDIYEILKLTDYFFPSSEEGKAIAKVKDERLAIKKLLFLGAKVVCLKMGKRGCLLGFEDTIKHLHAFQVNSVNTTGAGDIFLAGFIKCFLSGWDMEEAAIFASAAAALSTTKMGLEKYPSYKDVIDFLKVRGVEVGRK